MEHCIFCDQPLSPGSVEHVFLSALGNQLATRRAICLACNNAFATSATGKVDDSLAASFALVRNGLRIWSGRDGAPPTLPKAGVLDNGSEFDLAPGFAPIARTGKLPPTKDLPSGSVVPILAKDMADARRQVEILRKRGHNVAMDQAVLIQSKVPTVHYRTNFDIRKALRTAAKTAAVAFVVLHGNDQARSWLSKDLRAAIRHGTPNIEDFAGWDFTNDWPTMGFQPHHTTPEANLSGFEHSVAIVDVGSSSVAYLTFFGGWRISVRLGDATGLPPRGLAINPRSAKAARFVATCTAPTSYVPKDADSFGTEHAFNLAGNKKALDCAMRAWNEESRAENMGLLAEELQRAVAAAGDDQALREAEILTFAKKQIALENGEQWATDIGTLFDEGPEQP